MNHHSLKPTALLVALAVLALLFGGWLLTRRATAPTPPPGMSLETPGEQPLPVSQTLGPAPDFTRQTLDGQEVSLAQFRGQKAVLVNSWAIWCPFCVQELQDFATVAREFPDEVVILAVDRAESPDAQRAYLSNVRGTNLLESPLRFLTDPTDEVYRLLGGFGMPVTMFINKAGEVVFVKSGPLTIDEMRARMRAMLEGT